MPATLTYPGVYIEELPSSVRTITGVGTSITAFVGRAKKGPANKATMIHGFAEFNAIFGGLWANSAMSYAVQHYFLNGGSDALIVRVHNGATAATITLPTATGNIVLEAANAGTWGRGLTSVVDYNTSVPADTNLYNPTLVDANGVTEVFRNLSAAAGALRRVERVLKDESKLARAVTPTVDERPTATAATGIAASSVSGGDGSNIGDGQIIGSDVDPKTGIYALDEADLFNLLCIPPYHYDPAAANPDPASGTWTSALAYCKARRAMLIVDAPASWNDKGDPQDGTSGLDGTAGFGPGRSENAALYFPRVIALDPQDENRPKAFAPCGAVAGVIARTDGARGVWKAAAGIEATLLGVIDFSVRLTDKENGELNPLGINCLRFFDGIGRVVWGARTLRGADRLADQWKYLPVRRLALYIEETLYRGTQWVVFEPNDEPLWAQIRLNVGAFMHTLFRQGAFQGASPREAYLVKCDRETTTQDDINRGVVNILVGFAPLKPAEFVVIKIQQLAGQIQT
jgi:phage tail sheath protein FI